MACRTGYDVLRDHLYRYLKLEMTFCEDPKGFQRCTYLVDTCQLRAS